MSHSFGPLVPADETLHHQIVDTFNTVSQSDPSWTEKVWAIGHARDGSLQIVFGLGKYTNRGVYETAAGVSRGTDQWTVRAARPLWPDPDRMQSGPLRYEIIEPLRRIRCVMERNEFVDISFDATWVGCLEASLEEPWSDRSSDNSRVSHDILRYHQIGTIEGWVEVEGERFEITSDTWMSIRDHSWGLRPGIGKHIAGLRPDVYPARSLLTWMPALMKRDDGTNYALFAFIDDKEFDDRNEHRSQAEEQFEGGRSQRFAAATHDLNFDGKNRRFISGTITLIGTDGATRPLTLTPVSQTGFHLGTAGYFGWDGRPPGMFTAEEIVAGENLSGMDSPEVARQAHQLRDLLVHVEDPVGGGSGLGNIENLVLGSFPEKGLTSENNFL